MTTPTIDNKVKLPVAIFCDSGTMAKFRKICRKNRFSYSFMLYKLMMMFCSMSQEDIDKLILLKAENSDDPTPDTTT